MGELENELDDFLDCIIDTDYSKGDKYQLAPSTCDSIKIAFEIPFDKLPLYINDENQVIRLISVERLKNPK